VARAVWQPICTQILTALATSIHADDSKVELFAASLLYLEIAFIAQPRVLKVNAVCLRLVLATKLKSRYPRTFELIWRAKFEICEYPNCIRIISSTQSKINMTKSDFEPVLYSKAKEADLDGRHNSDINTKPLATPILETAKASKKKPSDDDGEEEDSSSSDSEDENITPLDEEKLKAALAMEGMDAKIKELYLGKEGVDGEEHEWVDRMPMAMQMKASAMSAKERERAKFAVLVRMELRPKSRFTDDNPMQIHSIVVQSPLLRRVLQRVFEGHPGVNSAESKLTFEKPLAPFVHRWRQFVQAAKEEEDPETKGHLNLLMDAVKPEIEATIMTKILCIENDSITFDKLWLIFEPGTLVVSASDKADCAYKLIKYSIRKNDRGCWFVMECVYTDWDGEIFGKAKEILAVAIFEGACKLSELDVIPLEIHKDKTTIVENLLKRGKRFKELAGMKNMVFRGTAIDRSEDPPKKIFVRPSLKFCHHK
jgi:hypothetical protein